MALPAAVEMIRAAQPSIHVNPGFEAQLTLFQDLGCTLLGDGGGGYRAPMAPATYRWFLFAHRIKSRGKGASVHEGSYPASGWDRRPRGTSGPPKTQAAGGRFQCRACRAPLFSEHEVIDHKHPIVRVSSDPDFESLHKHGDGTSWIAATNAAALAVCRGGPATDKIRTGVGAGFSRKNRGERFREKGNSSRQVEAGAPCTSVFTEALLLAGIVDANGNVAREGSSGKILCPGVSGKPCGSKLGAWSLEGKACSCGRTVKPAIQFTLSRIEFSRQVPRALP